jgi:hypothetical protein
MKRPLFALLLVACGAPAAPPTDAPDAGDAAPAKVEVTGAVVDSQGAAWGAAKIQVCSETVCTLGDADETGAFAVAVPAGDRYHVIARPGPGDSRAGSAGVGVFPSVVVSDTALAAPVVLPVTGAEIALDPDGGAVDAAVTADLTLSARAADLDFYGEPYLAAVRLDAAAWPALSTPGTVLAVWALNPWGTRAETGKSIAVTIRNDFGLAPGELAQVYAISETTAEVGAPSDAVVSDDGAVIAGATVDRVTWIVLARAP